MLNVTTYHSEEWVKMGRQGWRIRYAVFIRCANLHQNFNF